MLAKDIKRGSVVVYNDAPCMIETVAVNSPSARGAATYYKFKARNLITKQKVDLSIRGQDSLDEADYYRRPVKLMYSDETHVHFLDSEDYNQHSLPVEDITDEMQFITEELEGVAAMIYDEQCIGLVVPMTVELKVTQCDPGVRGNSATSRTKPATLETGLTVQVPEYLEQGEIVKVDTRTGDYLSRAR
jgi:elongation factor P